MLSSTSAVARLFATTELLESIIYLLPQNDILLSQRVDRSWRAAISGSIKIQQALFLKPLPGGVLELPEAKTRYGRLITNPLLTPLMKHLAAEFHDDEETYCSVSEFLVRSQLSAWSDAKGSWQSMLLTQPATEMTFLISFYRNVLVGPEDERDDWLSSDCVGDSGKLSAVTMGAAMARICQAMREGFARYGGNVDALVAFDDVGDGANENGELEIWIHGDYGEYIMDDDEKLEGLIKFSKKRS